MFSAHLPDMHGMTDADHLPGAKLLKMWTRGGVSDWAAGKRTTSAERGWAGAIAALVGIPLIHAIGFAPAMGILIAATALRGFTKRMASGPPQRREDDGPRVPMSNLEYGASLAAVLSLAFAIFGSLVIGMTPVYIGGGIIIVASLVILDEQNRLRRRYDVPDLSRR
jgi:hypothetical protein